MLFANPAAALASQADVLKPIARLTQLSPCLVLIHLPRDRGAAGIVVPVEKFAWARDFFRSESKLGSVQRNNYDVATASLRGEYESRHRADGDGFLRQLRARHSGAVDIQPAEPWRHEAMPKVADH